MKTSEKKFIAFIGLELLQTVITLSVAARDKQPNQTNQLQMRAKPAIVRILSGYAGRWVWRERQWETQSVGLGSGFIFNPNGYILVNAHVVDATKNGDEQGKRLL